MAHPLSSAPRFTYRDYRIWTGEDRWELHDGEAVPMSPAPSRAHQHAVLAIARQIADRIEGGPCRVYVAPFDVRLPGDAEADDRVVDVVQPDVSVICDAAKLDDRGCRGAPDWIVEVRSESTAVVDEVRKARLYERHGVREYWIVRLEEKTAAIHRLGPDRRYAPAEIVPLSGDTAAAALPRIAIRWSHVVEV